MPDAVLYAVLSIYVIQFFILLVGFARNIEEPCSGAEPGVSVIVAARNEEETIERCIRSVLGNDYPPEKTEIVLINDSSTDGTGGIMERYANRYPNVRYVPIGRELQNIRGKANALAQGIRESKGEILLFTDADCEVPGGWIRKQISYFGERTGIVGGFTRLRSHNWFSGMQALDWFFLYSVAAAITALGKPVTAVGNNLCVRREAYDEVGGYERLPFSVTEDYILVNAIRKTGRWDIKFPADRETLVVSNPCPDIRSLSRQKHRWATGGGDMEPGAFLFFTPIYLLHVLILLFPLIGFLPALGALLVKVGIDILFVQRTLRIFGALPLLRYLVPFEILMGLYVLVLPFQIVFSRKVIWKDRSYAT
jgi:1,2-diacylglycerol 3-beta-glucosyltransferase